MSIIIVCYNYGKYLPCAIKSAIRQTYQNVEVIVADDGSDDNSVAVAKKYPVNVLRLKHGGLAEAVDAGIKSSKGEFFIILSADDKLHPSFVERTLGTNHENPGKAFVYTQYYLFGAANGMCKSSTYDARTLIMGNYIVATALMRRRIYDKYGSYDPKLESHEDWDYWLRLAENGEEGVLLDAPLFYYRLHKKGNRNRRGGIELFNAKKEIRKNHAGLLRSLSFQERGMMELTDYLELAMNMIREIRDSIIKE